MKSYAYRKARRLLRREEPLPLDLIIQLTEEGIDVSLAESRITGKEDHTYADFN